MRPEACEGALLRRLASMPFLDRLERAGMVESVDHAAPLVPPTRRY